jgi:exopolysaccharide production protein ExoZ
MQHADPKPIDAKPKTINAIQVMRGLAAVAVVLFHTHIILNQPAYGGIDVFGDLTSRGWMGVNLFFVLSGFIIMFAHAKDIGQPKALGRYGWRRVSRVYPVYWIFLTLYILAAYFGFGNADFGWSAPNLISAYALIKFTPDLSLPLSVAWTLFYEMQFYAIFALLIFNRLVGIVTFAIWLAAIFIANIFVGNVGMGLLHMWNINFMFGVLAYFLYTKLPAKFGYAILATGFAGLGIALWLIPEGRVFQIEKQPVKLFLLGVPFGLILLGSALSERFLSWTPPQWLTTLGAASYSIYIVHSPAISLIAIINKKLTHGLIPEALLFTLTAAFSIMAGCIVHILIERPLLRVMREDRWLARVSKPFQRGSERV